MTTKKESVDVECSLALRLIVPMDSLEPSMTDTESVFIRVHPWQEFSFTVPINSRQELCVIETEALA